jgi:succinate dehydrogenase/fumarate reductase cytochrome b subunit
MADAATTADAVRTDAGADHSFLWRRLHSLSGVLPLGAFLCYHVFENLSALRGPPRTTRWSTT